MSATTYEELCASLPDSIRENREQVLAICREAKVEVPLSERFYVKNHTPQQSKNNPNPQPNDYVVVPNPRGGRRDLWVRKEDFASLLSAGIEFGTRTGLVETDSE